MKLLTWEQFLEQWVKGDPENEGCYTEQDVYQFYLLHEDDYRNWCILNPA